MTIDYFTTALTYSALGFAGGFATCRAWCLKRRGRV